MQNISIKNFRCYENLQLDFCKGINLIIGDNASGKTSFLQACKYALAAFFAGFSDENTKWIAPTKEDFRIVYDNDNNVLNEEEINITFCQGNIFENSDGEFSIIKRSKKNSRALTSGIAAYKNNSATLFKNYAQENKPLPLFANFTTEDIHSKRKLSKRQFLSYKTKPSFGYIECLECNGLMDYWQKRLLVLKEVGQDSDVEIVCAAVEKALGASGCGFVGRMYVRPIRKGIFYQLLDGREIESNFLSDGYKRLVNIVTDIAFRCVLLNKRIYGAECIGKTQGTVLIDEIDMHLHPMLQSKVLKGLQDTFQNLQFIVTTHAPMVMTGVVSDKKNSVFKLSYTDGCYNVAKVRTYGMDASKIIELILGVTPRDIGVEKELKLLFGYIDSNETEKASSKLETLKKRFGDSLPELVQAQAMLDFNSIVYND